MFREDGKITVSVDEALRVYNKMPFACYHYIKTLTSKVLHGDDVKAEPRLVFYYVALAALTAGYIQGVRDERSKRRKA